MDHVVYISRATDNKVNLLICLCCADFSVSAVGGITTFLINYSDEYHYYYH